jgi:hypothetical protein
MSQLQQEWPDDRYPPDDDDDPYERQSTTACCPRQTIPDSCSCLEGCQCLCRDCDCSGWGEEPY